jgi:hypothetical protein
MVKNFCMQQGMLYDGRESRHCMMAKTLRCKIKSWLNAMSINTTFQQWIDEPDVIESLSMTESCTAVNHLYRVSRVGIGGDVSGPGRAAFMSELCKVKRGGKHAGMQYQANDLLCVRLAY